MALPGWLEERALRPNRPRGMRIGSRRRPRGRGAVGASEYQQHQDATAEEEGEEEDDEEF